MSAHPSTNQVDTLTSIRFFVAMSAFTYHFFELPVRNFLRNAFASGHKLKPQFS